MKTSRIQSRQGTLFANDTQLNRVRKFGSSGKLDSDDIYEIGNLDLVEVVDNVPSVDITVEAAQYGSMQGLRKFSRKNFDWSTSSVTVNGAASVAVSAGYAFIGEMRYSVSAATLNITAPSGANMNRIDSIVVGVSGTPTVVVGTAVTGTPVCPATPAGDLKLAEVEIQNDGTGATKPFGKYNVLNCYDEVATHLQDFDEAAVDFALAVKLLGDNTTTDPIAYTQYTSHAFMNKYDMDFAVNGLATESFSFESDNKTYFQKTGAVVFTDRFAGDGVLTAFTTTYVPRVMDNGKALLAAYTYTAGAYKDLELVTDYTVSGSTVTLLTAPASGTVLVVRYTTDPASVSAADMPFFHRNPGTPDMHPGVAGGLKHGQVEIYLSDDNANPVLRLQRATVSVSLTREALYEIAHVRAYDRPTTYPIPITLQLEATASDLEEFMRLCGKDSDTDSEVSIDDFAKNLTLVAKIYRETDLVRAEAPHIQSNPLKTITVNNIVVTDESFDLSTDNAATQSFSFKTSNSLTVSGRI